MQSSFITRFPVTIAVETYFWHYCSVTHTIGFSPCIKPYHTSTPPVLLKIPPCISFFIISYYHSIQYFHNNSSWEVFPKVPLRGGSGVLLLSQKSTVPAPPTRHHSPHQRASGGRHGTIPPPPTFPIQGGGEPAFTITQSISCLYHSSLSHFPGNFRQVFTSLRPSWEACMIASGYCLRGANKWHSSRVGILE